MLRRSFQSYTLISVMFTLVVSGTQTGLIGGLVGTISDVAPKLISSLVKVVSPHYDPHRFVIIMDDDIKSVIDAVANPSAGPWTNDERAHNIQNIVNALKQHAQERQDPVKQVLEKANFQYTSNWISNTIEVVDCPTNLVQQILDVTIVKEIIYDIIIDHDSIESEIDATNTTIPMGWGVKKINAPNVWALNNTGQNIIVGNIDTGVRSTHETLVNNWVGPYGWYDPKQQSATPFDANGHGTHTIATIAGGKGVGVAPGAKWMACKGCGATGCTLSLLIACAEFMLCPTDTNGNNCDPTKSPHIVSNSWGRGQGMGYFQPSLDAWHAARIIPVFSAGNLGRSGCSSVGYPGDSPDVLASGATDMNDVLGVFSSLGPSVKGLIKPDFSSPGVDILSAWNRDDSDYKLMSGTSMAAPHLAGTIALILSARPGLSFDAVKTLLIGSTEQALPKAVLTCGGTLDDVYPNNQHGHGRINAEKVVNAALAL
ncbi:serine protease family [Plasmopara halstedii]|uniref:subtilisin n=1 Tax=Plasmopara halstedii TaxID=4781 RepID=A0A0P1A845_PLAHL|nr:serine protease family [Plasmopara halstedii]CEG36812.1 serine protease family [Plasmopara halstedii]|eukprot:XP_024573181.1 serine protease family [Plasmopara halstedii]